MRTWLTALDNILRGETTRAAALRDGMPDIPVRGLAVVSLLLASFYGFCMGWFALFGREEPEWRLLLSGALKVPALFVLTVAVTFPSLYVFNALVGSRLKWGELYRLLVASLSVTTAVLASFGPIVVFFALTTNNYPFMVLLNVGVFGVAGLLGSAFLLKTMHRLTLPVPTLVAADEPDESPRTRGPLAPVEGSVLGNNVRAVFVCWMALFALVGTQMGWVLRPFIGDPDREFAWFRARESSFVEALQRTLAAVFGM